MLASDERECVLHVLFVDDEPQVLESLQDTLRPRRNEWDMAFAASARVALDMLERRAFDVVVSDVRMPEMDGVAFFEEVRHQWPQSIRIALTGHADGLASRRLAVVAHQYLAKPTSTDALQETLERAARVRRLIGDPRVRGIVGRIEHLPPRPRVYGELLAAIQSTDSSATDIACILGREPALAAKLLQLVNSSFFRLARTITRVEDAVVHLGMIQIRNLILSAEIFQGGNDLTPGCGLSVDQIQAHALLSARIAARVSSATMSGEAFLAGIVHDVGLLVLGLEMPQRLARALSEGRRQNLTLTEALRSSLGVTSAEVGGYLLGLWGLPEALLEAVVHHDRPAGEGGFGLVGVLHVADALAAKYTPPVAGFLAEPLDEGYLAAAGVADRVGSFVAAAAAEAGSDS